MLRPNKEVKEPRSRSRGTSSLGPAALKLMTKARGAATLDVPEDVVGMGTEEGICANWEHRLCGRMHGFLGSSAKETRANPNAQSELARLAEASALKSGVKRPWLLFFRPNFQTCRTTMVMMKHKHGIMPRTGKYKGQPVAGHAFPRRCRRGRERCNKLTCLATCGSFITESPSRRSWRCSLRGGAWRRG